MPTTVTEETTFAGNADAGGEIRLVGELAVGGLVEFTISRVLLETLSGCMGRTHPVEVSLESEAPFLEVQITDCQISESDTGKVIPNPYDGGLHFHLQNYSSDETVSLRVSLDITFDNPLGELGRGVTFSLKSRG